MRIVEQTKTRLILQQDPDTSAALIIGCLCVGLGSFLLCFGIVAAVYGRGVVLSVVLLSPILGFLSIAFGFLAAAEKIGSVNCYFNKPLDRLLLKVQGLESNVIECSVREIAMVIVIKHKKKLYLPGKPKSSKSYSISLLMASGENITLTVDKLLDANTSSSLAKCVAEFLQIPLSKL
ncbi:hypothetical protein [Argonema galeatum]|uniref:hypothetical protein n=1 Tax=Argonema galeatum TaxID=2942762 RepID=UPI002013656A|nr:hypothetical protein [Argonema galeatum]MCL1462826.1 hypothetical protein [Argonema galeatum A003/A1]